MKKLARFLPSQLYPFYSLRIRSIPIIHNFSIIPAISCPKRPGEYFNYHNNKIKFYFINQINLLTCGGGLWIDWMKC